MFIHLPETAQNALFSLINICINLFILIMIKSFVRKVLYIYYMYNYVHKITEGLSQFMYGKDSKYVYNIYVCLLIFKFLVLQISIKNYFVNNQHESDCYMICSNILSIINIVNSSKD